MKLIPRSIAVLSLALFVGTPAFAEEKVTLKDVHLCCGGCVKGVNTALKGIEGVKAAIDSDAKTVLLSGTDTKALKKALAALGKAGYFGTSDNDKYGVPTQKDAPNGKVETLTLVGFHNCCRSCARDLLEAAQSVDGIDKVTVSKETLVATGNFDAAALVKAMHDAGFSVRSQKQN